MSLQEAGMLVGYIAAFAAIGTAWQNRQKIAAVFRYFVMSHPRPRTAHADVSGSGVEGAGGVENQAEVECLQRGAVVGHVSTEGDRISR